MLQNQIRRKVLSQMAGGVMLSSIPIGLWWKRASDERKKTLEEVRTRVRIVGQVTTDDMLLEDKCQAGDVVLFDRRCEKCASGPWAALSCLAQKQFLCDDTLSTTNNRMVDGGRFDHMGLIVPGYDKDRNDALDPSNLLLLEATSSGIVARKLKTRFESSQSRSVLLLQLCSPGEKRNLREDDDDYDDRESSRALQVRRTRDHVEKELKRFRDRWLELGQAKNYQWIHSTVCLGGALATAVRWPDDQLSGPISPSAYLALMGLQKAAAAQNISERENRTVKVEDFLRDHRFEEKHSVRLRPGWRFLAPIPVRETSRL